MNNIKYYNKIIAFHIKDMDKRIIKGNPYLEYSDIIYLYNNFYNIIKNIIDFYNDKDIINPKSLFIDVNSDIKNIVKSIEFVKNYSKFIADVWFIYRINKYNIDLFNSLFYKSIDLIVDLQQEPKIILDVSNSNKDDVLHFLKNTIVNNSLAELIIFDSDTRTRLPIIHIVDNTDILAINNSLINYRGKSISVNDLDHEIEKRYKIIKNSTINFEKIAIKKNFNITRFGAIVFEITRECNLKCMHCYVSCSPLHNKVHLKYDKIIEVIDDATKIPEEIVDRKVSLAGGEATLPKFVDLTLNALRHAKSRGFLVELVSNGYFALLGRNYVDRFSEILDVLELSLSPFHLSQVSDNDLNKILYAIDYLASRHIYTVIRYQTTLLNRLDILYRRAGSRLHGLRIFTSPVISLGRASLKLRDEIARKPLEVLTNTCWTNLNVTVNYDGSVTPCCAGSELMKFMKYGNIYDESIVNIVNRMVSDPYLYVLTHFGPQKLLIYIKKNYPELLKKYRVPDDFSDICEACFYLNTRKELYEHAKNYINDIVKKVYG